MVTINEELKNIRVFSDLHLDYDFNAKNKKFNPIKDLWYPEILPDDKQSTLILAGDIWHSKKAFSFMNFSWYKEVSERFKRVIVVLGNHDFWSGRLDQEVGKCKEKALEQGIDNIYFLNNEFIEFNNYRLLGSTLWLDFNKKDLSAIEAFNQIANDKKYIRLGNNFSRLKDFHIYQEFSKAKHFIDKNLSTEKPNFIVTHHPPSQKCMAEDHLQDMKRLEAIKHLSQKNFIDYYGYFLDFNNLDDFIEQRPSIAYWVFGHNHHACEFQIGNTHLINNSRGYVGQSNNYDPWFEIDVSKPHLDNKAKCKI